MVDPHHPDKTPRTTEIPGAQNIASRSRVVLHRSAGRRKIGPGREQRAPAGRRRAFPQAEQQRQRQATAGGMAGKHSFQPHGHRSTARYTRPRRLRPPRETDIPGANRYSGANTENPRRAIGPESQHGGSAASRRNSRRHAGYNRIGFGAASERAHSPAMPPTRARGERHPLRHRQLRPVLALHRLAHAGQVGVTMTLRLNCRRTAKSRKCACRLAMRHRRRRFAWLWRKVQGDHRLRYFQ